MSSKDTAIKVVGLSKHYLMFKQPQDRLKQMILPKLQNLAFMKPKQYYKDFAAVRNVSVEIKRGETVGIIGRNGSGKSTFLQLVCQILQPSQGTVHVNGRVAALLELGAGFNPDFTGRENVYMNAAILGASKKEINERFDSIAQFADIGDFMDQPVKTYSSGMYIRLAFAVAINVDADILIVDEALSVGDEAFQRKCFTRIEQIQENGGTILFVSHNAGSIVQLCSRAIFMDRGEIIMEGHPKTVTNQYQRFINLSGDEAAAVRDEIKTLDGWANIPETENTSLAGDQGASVDGGEKISIAIDPDEGADESWHDPNLISHSRVEYESKGAVIRDVKISTPDGRQVNMLESGKRYFYQYVVQFSQNATNVGFGMMIKTVQGVELGGAATDFEKTLRLKQVKAGSVYAVTFDLVWNLTPGLFFLNAGVTGIIEGHEGTYSHRLLDACAFKIMPSKKRIATGLIDFNASPSYEIIDSSGSV